MKEPRPGESEPASDSKLQFDGQAVIEVLRLAVFKVEQQQQHMQIVNSRCLIWKANTYNLIKSEGKRKLWEELNSQPLVL